LEAAIKHVCWKAKRQNLIAFYVCKRYENLIFRRKLSSDDTATVFNEPVQREDGYVISPAEFQKEVREICMDNDVLLMVDEVQTGCF
jgi:4-aminobutyrate aminotransferase-like enzyme